MSYSARLRPKFRPAEASVYSRPVNCIHDFWSYSRPFIIIIIIILILMIMIIVMIIMIIMTRKTIIIMIMIIL